jgi:hypothetical protein
MKRLSTAQFARRCGAPVAGVFCNIGDVVTVHGAPLEGWRSLPCHQVAGAPTALCLRSPEGRREHQLKQNEVRFSEGPGATSAARNGPDCAGPPTIIDCDGFPYFTQIISGNGICPLTK